MTAASRDDQPPSPELAPRRMLDGGAGDIEQRMIASAQLDRVPSAAKARVAAALGGLLEPPVLPDIEPRDPERTPRAEALPRFGTRAGLGLVGAGILGVIALSVALRAAPRASDSASATPPASVTESMAPPSGEARLGPTEPRGTASLEPIERAEHVQPAEPARLLQQALPARPARPLPQRAKAHADPSRAEPVDSGLLAEVRALEAVSTQLAAAQPERAARALDAYRRRFARGELAIEADVLAIQIAVARGDQRAARASAERLFARPEAEHYHARVRALLAGEENAGTSEP